MSDPSATVIVVEHRDRLARFGVEHLDAALAAQGPRVLVAGAGETADDVVLDMIEVLTGMGAGRYGRRGARNRAMRAVRAAKNAGVEEAAWPMLQAYWFALDPAPAQARVLASHGGAARKAFNEGLTHVRRCLDQRGAERSCGVPDGLLTEVPWTLPAVGQRAENIVIGPLG